MSKIKQKILIVDDKSANLIALKKVLEEVAAEIIAAGSGEEALGICLNHDFDLGIIDVQMPEMDGFELAELLLGDPKTKQMPVIFLSAALQEEQHVFKGYKAGCVDYLVKPFNPEFLLSKVRVFLELANHRRRLEDLVAARTKELSEEVAIRREAEAQLQGFVKNTLELHYSCNPDGTFIYVNPSWETILGYEAREAGSMNFLSIVEDESKHFMKKLHQNALQGNGANDVSTRFISSSGKIVHLRGNIAPFLEKGKKPVVLGFFRDVTQQVQAEEDRKHALRLAESATRETAALLHGARTILFENDVEAVAAELVRVCSFLEEGLEVVAGELLRICVDGAQADRGFIALWSKPVDLKKLGITHGMIKSAAISAEETPIEDWLNTLPVANGGVVLTEPPTTEIIESLVKHDHLILGNAFVAPVISENCLTGCVYLKSKGHDYDVHDARLAKGFSELLCIARRNGDTLTALRNSEEKFKQFFNVAPEFCFLVSPEGLIIDFNNVVEKELGYSRIELIGKHLRSIFAKDEIIPESSKELWDWLCRMQNVEQRIFRKNKEAILILMSASKVDDQNGETKHFAIVQRDISKRKEVETSLAQSDRLASMGMLAAGVAHEINNPLTYVLYNLETLANELPADLKAENSEDGCKELASEALQGAERIQRIVKDLRIFSRVDEERSLAIDVNSVMKGALNIAQNELRFRATVEEDYDEVPLITANDGKLSQVFLNLLVNAAHSIEEGNSSNNFVRIKTKCSNNSVIVEVEDTGKGIDKEVLPHIFEPFYTTKELGVGSGLGLSISRNIIEKLGGRISVTSKPGLGTKFSIKLPQRKNEKTVENNQKQVDKNRNCPHAKVLIVDDEVAVANVLHRVLKKSYDVKVVYGGGEAIELIKSGERFDVILCDMMMPEVSGMDLYFWLEENALEQAKKIVFTTGGAFTPKAMEFLKNCKRNFLEKPVSPQKIRGLIQEMLQDDKE